MKCEFSESSYAFSLVSELIQTGELGSIVAAPFAPSTYKEGTKGYDIKLSRKGKPLFLQFKIPDYIVQKRSSSTSPYPSPFFRIKMWNRQVSDQHNVLKKLSDANPATVFYVAPAFHELVEFNSLFMSSSISKNSAFFSLNNLPFIKDYDDHHIYYTEPGKHFSAKACFCSDPKHVDGFGFESAKTLISQLEAVDIDSFCRTTLIQLREYIGDDERMPPIRPFDDNLSPYYALQDYLLAFGVSLLFIK